MPVTQVVSATHLLPLFVPLDLMYTLYAQAGGGRHGRGPCHRGQRGASVAPLRACYVPMQMLSATT